MNFIIVSYTFPPAEGIGGRRWSKMAYYLAKAGHDVRVICADHGGDDDYYQKRMPGIEVHNIPGLYPDWLSGRANTWLKKVYYAFTTRVLARLGKKNWFDKGLFWRQILLSKLNALHKMKPLDVLIVSGAPFSTLYYGAIFKSNNPEIIYAADLRDPWTWGKGYGMSIITEAQQLEQKRMEETVVRTADVIVCPAHRMVQHLQAAYPNHAEKVKILPHAYDERDFDQVQRMAGRGNGELVYGGTLYDGMDAFFDELSQVLVKHPDLVFEWHIYTGSEKRYQLNGPVSSVQMIHYHKQVPPTEFFCRLAGASWYLVYFPEQYKDFISTKFYEIFYLDVPVIYVGYDGMVSRFITEHGFGVHIQPGELEQKLPDLLRNGYKPSPGHEPCDLSQFSFAAVTGKFLSDIESIAHSGQN